MAFMLFFMPISVCSCYLERCYVGMEEAGKELATE